MHEVCNLQASAPMDCAQQRELAEVTLPITLEHNGTDFDLFRLLRLIVTGVFSSPCRTFPIALAGSRNTT
jgi:hypothetical protein